MPQIGFKWPECRTLLSKTFFRDALYKNLKNKTSLLHSLLPKCLIIITITQCLFVNHHHYLFLVYSTYDITENISASESSSSSFTGLRITFSSRGPSSPSFTTTSPLCSPPASPLDCYGYEEQCSTTQNSS